MLGHVTSIRRSHRLLLRVLGYLTCKAVQCLFGQDGGLQGQLTDAELAGEWQVSQVAVSTANLLRPGKTRQLADKRLWCM